LRGRWDEARTHAGIAVRGVRLDFHNSVNIFFRPGSLHKSVNRLLVVVIELEGSIAVAAPEEEGNLDILKVGNVLQDAAESLFCEGEQPNENPVGQPLLTILHFGNLDSLDGLEGGIS